MKKILYFLLCSVFAVLTLGCAKKIRTPDWYQKNRSVLLEQLKECESTHPSEDKNKESNCTNAKAAFDELYQSSQTAADLAIPVKSFIANVIVHKGELSTFEEWNDAEAFGIVKSPLLHLDTNTGKITVALTGELQGTHLFITPSLENSLIKFTCFTDARQQDMIFIIKECANKG